MENLALARKSLKKTLFKKPDYDTAITYLQDAAKQFRNEKNYLKSAEIYLEAAEICIPQNLNLPAAVNFKSAAENFKLLENVELYKLSMRKSVDQWQLAGKFTEAGRSLIEAGEVQEGVDLLLQEGKPVQAIASLQEFAEAEIEQERYINAIQIYKQIIVQVGKLQKIMHKIDQINLSIVIVLLHLQDMVSAEQQLEYFNDFNSDEAEMAEKLIRGIQDNDQLMFEEGKKNQGGRLAVGNVILGVLNLVEFEQNDL